MNNLSSFLKNFKVLGLFLSLELVALALLLQFNTYQNSILFNISNSIRTNIFNGISIITNYPNLEKQNNDLIIENAMLLETIEKLKENKLQKIPLELNKYDCIPAKIVHSSINIPDNYLIIDKGTADSVHSEMAVITPNGIVGLIYACSENYSTILPIINTSFSCLASIRNYTLSSNTSWNAMDYRYVNIENVPLHIDVNQGDTIFTNNNSMLYPNGIVIGTVDGIKTVDLGKSKELKVKLGVNFAKTRHVYILKNNHKKQIDSLINNE